MYTVGLVINYKILCLGYRAVQNEILASIVIPNSIYSSTVLWVLVLNLRVNEVKSTGGNFPVYYCSI